MRLLSAATWTLVVTGHTHIQYPLKPSQNFLHFSYFCHSFLLSHFMRPLIVATFLIDLICGIFWSLLTAMTIQGFLIFGQAFRWQRILLVLSFSVFAFRILSKKEGYRVWGGRCVFGVHFWSEAVVNVFIIHVYLLSFQQSQMFKSFQL